MVSGGYLYIVKNSKSVLQRPKDGFNQYIELNNIIPHVGLHEHLPPSTLQGFTEAINKGYHIINAEVRFTSDKMPVICDDNKLEDISNGKGNIANKTFQQLEELNFGSKFDKKYSDEKIMTLAELLALCRQSDVIIDLNLDNLDYNKYFNSTRQYMYIIIRTIENLQMMNSVIFEGSADKILKLKEIRTDKDKENEKNNNPMNNSNIENKMNESNELHSNNAFSHIEENIINIKEEIQKK